MIPRSPRLAEYLLRNQISAQQRRAGDMFLGDWQAHQQALAHRRADAVAGGCDADRNIMAIAASRRVRQVRQALGWDRPRRSMEARAVEGVVLRDLSCRELAIECEWAQPGTAMTALREGLRVLVEVYQPVVSEQLEGVA